LAQAKNVFQYRGNFRSRRKKTRQGNSHNTKLKPGQKKYRGQGK